MQRPRNISIIIKVTEQCNLSCKYCYQSTRSNLPVMHPDVLRKVTTSALQASCEGVDFIWHGGEPLLAGTSFFQLALDLQKKLGKNKMILNSIQTNLTLVDEEIAWFLKDNKFRIGISIDGPKSIHDRYRVYPDGNGTFEDVMSSLKTLREVGGDTAAICVITKESILRFKEIYDFFNSLKIDFRMNPVMPDANLRDTLPLPDEFGKMLIDFFNLWSEDGSSACEVANFTEIIDSFVLGWQNHCIFMDSCFGNFLSIDPKGNIYPCDTFCNREGFVLGHISECSIEEALEGTHISTLRKKRLEGVRKACVSCKHISYCFGGCPHNALLSNKDVTKKDYYCRSYGMLFDHIAGWLTKMDRSKAGQI